MATDRLSTRAEALGDMLGVLSRLTGEATALLDALGGSLAHLAELTAPIHARATALNAAQRNVAATKAEADALLEHLDAARRLAGPLTAGPGADLPAFLAALEALERSVAFLRRHARLAAVQAALGGAQALFDRALAACDADFAATLADAVAERAPPPAWLAQRLADGTDYPTDAEAIGDLAFELVPADVAPKLRRMAAVMLDAGYAPGRDGYVAARDRALEAALRGVGQETPFAAGLRALAPDALERVAAAWARRLRALALLAPSEHRLAVSVWPAPEGARLFFRVVGRQLRQLAQAGRDIAEARHAPDRAFALLEVHAALGGAVPGLRAALSGAAPWRRAAAAAVGDEAAEVSAAARLSLDDGDDAAAAAAADGGGDDDTAYEPLRAALLGELAALRGCVARAAAALVAAYADAVAKDASRVLPPDGTIHPLTAQAVGFVKRLLSYEEAAQVLASGEDGSFGGEGSGGGAGGGPEGGSGGDEARQRLAAAVARLLDGLAANLEAKARAYPRAEPALAALFLMNNAHYVAWAAEGGALEALLGRDWLERQRDAVEEWGARYHEATWAPVVALLQAEPPADVARLKQHLKDAFSGFNAAVDRIRAAQSAWTVPDAALRAAVRRVIHADVVEPYQRFLRRYADVQFSSAPARYIRYAAADVRGVVDGDLFESKELPSTRLDLKQQKLAAIM